MFTLLLLFQWASIIKIQLSLLIYYKADIITISWYVNCSRIKIAANSSSVRQQRQLQETLITQAEYSHIQF